MNGRKREIVNVQFFLKKQQILGLYYVAGSLAVKRPFKARNLNKIYKQKLKYFIFGCQCNKSEKTKAIAKVKTFLLPIH